MKRPYQVAVFLSSFCFAACSSVTPYHTSDSPAFDQLLYPSELTVDTQRYEKEGMPHKEALARAYSELDPKEKPYYSAEAEELRPKELTPAEIKALKQQYQ